MKTGSMSNPVMVAKTGVSLAVIALVVAGVSLGRAKTSGNQAEDTLAKITRTKEMNVCVAEWPPFSIKDAKTGAYSGVDIEALNAAAKALGATAVYHDTTFGNIPAALQSGVCDVATSLYVTTTRAAVVNFTTPVLYGGDTALVRKGDARFKTVADLDQPGIKVATATGESGDIYAKANLTKSKVVAIDTDAADQARFMLEVTSGRADVAIADFNTIANFAKEHPETEVVFKENPFNLSPDAYGVRYSDTGLVNFLNNSLLTMKANGTWEASMKKYGATAFEDKLNIK